MTNHIEELRKLIPDGDGCNSDYAHTLLDTVAYIKKLEEDKKRIDWLADKNQSIGNVMLPTQCVERNLGSLRGAIDDARNR